jgi:hypothetical protein
VERTARIQESYVAAKKKYVGWAGARRVRALRAGRKKQQVGKSGGEQNNILHPESQIAGWMDRLAIPRWVFDWLVRT